MAHLGFIGRELERRKADTADAMAVEVVEHSPVGETGDFRDAWRRDGLSGENTDPAGPFIEKGASSQAPAGVMRPAALAALARYR